MNTNFRTLECYSSKGRFIDYCRIKIAFLFFLICCFPQALISSTNVTGPQLKAIKSIQKTENQPNGNIAILYKIGIKNIGTTDLNNLDLNFEAASQIGGAYIDLPSTGFAISIFSSSATMPPQVNDDFDGNQNTNLFQDDVLDILGEEEEVFVLVAIEIDPFLASWPINTYVTVVGEGDDGTGVIVQVQDVSDSGTSFFGNNPDAPGDNGGSDDPTELTCVVSNIILNAPESICPDDNFEIIVNSDIPTVNYEWFIAGDTISINSGSELMMSSISVPTTFQVLAINEEETCFYDVNKEVEIEIFEIPIVEPEAVITLGSDCSASDVAFFANQQEGDTTVLSYIWSGGNYGWVSTQVDPSIVNAHSYYNGTYVLEATDANGCTGVGEVEVSGLFLSTQPGNPESGIIALNSSDTDCNSLNTDGLKLSTPDFQMAGEDVIYEWVTPNGLTNNISGLGTNEIVINPIDLSIHQGAYYVHITAGDCILDSDTFNLQVFNAIEDPEVLIESNDALCEGGQFKLIANNSNAFSYEWTGPDGFVSVDENPILSNVTISNNGIYTLTIYSPDGCSFSRNVTMDQIDSRPSTPIVDGEESICEDEIISLNHTESYPPSVNYQWTNGLGVIVGSASVLSLDSNDPSAISPFQLKVSALDCDSELSNAFEVDVVPFPDINISSSIGTDVCSGQPVQLNATVVSGASYEWNIEGSSTIVSTSPNPVFVPEEPFTTYVLTVYFQECESSTSCSIEIESQPGLTIGVEQDFTLNENCIPTEINLSSEINSGGGTILNYEWTGPNGFTSSESNPVITDISENNNGNYELTVTTIEGCTSTNDFEVLLEFEPVPEPIISSSTDVFCEGETVNLSVPEYIGTSVVYNWTIPIAATGNVSGLNSNALLLSNVNELIHDGDYLLEVEVDGCTLSSSSFNVETLVTPSIEISSSTGSIACVGQDIALSSTAISGGSYEWRIQGNATIISTEQNPVFSSVNNDVIYELTVIEPVCSNAILKTIEIEVQPALEINTEADYVLDNNCVPTEIYLSSEILSGTGTIMNYEWMGPNGFVSTANNPVITNISAANNGNYILLVTTTEGCTASSSFEITNAFEPVAQPIINNDATSACEGETIVLYVPEYTGNNIVYNWTVPVGAENQVGGLNTNELTIPLLSTSIHNGMYSLTIEVDGCNIISDFYEVEVFELPSINPGLDNNESICEGETLLLSANATGVNNFYWTGPNGFSSVDANPLIDNASVSNNGMYMLAGIGEGGCFVEQSIIIENINVIPPSPEISSSAMVVCEGESFDLEFLNTNPSGSLSYQWTNDNGAIIGTSENLNLEAGSPLAVPPFTLLVDNGNCIATSDVPLDVEIIPMPDFNVESVGAICAGEEIQLSSSVISNAIYEWRVLGSSPLISNIPNPVISPLIETTSFELTVSTQGCTWEPVVTEVIVNQNPVLNPSINYSLNQDCSPADFSLFANIALGTGNNLSYQWTGPDSFNSSLENPVIPNAQENNNGTYIVYVIDEFSCSANALVEANQINDMPEEPVISNQSSNCGDTEIVLNIPGYTGNIVTYQWTTPSGLNISGETTNEIIITNADPNIHNGNYTIEVVVDECTLVSEIYNLELAVLPDLSIDVSNQDQICDGDNLAFQVEADGVTSYQWTGPNGFVSDQAQPVINDVDVTNNGVYTLVVLNSQGCSASETIEISSITSQPQTPLLNSQSDYCENELIEVNILQNYDGNDVVYNWYNGAGVLVSTAQTLSMNLNDPLAITPFYAVVMVDGCESEASAYLEFDANSNPIAVAGNNGPSCFGEPVFLNANQMVGGNYYWYESDPFASSPPPSVISIEQNPQINNLQIGTHSFYLLVENENGCMSEEASVTAVEVETQLIISEVVGEGDYCEGETVFLSAMNTVPYFGLISYTWTGPNGFLYDGVSLDGENYALTIPDFSSTMSGVYHLEVNLSNGCEVAPVSALVQSVENPESPILFTSSNVFCEGENITLTASGNTTNSDYEWFFTSASGTVSLGTSSIPIFILENVDSTNTGFYSLVISNGNCASSFSNTEGIEVVNGFEIPEISNNTSATDPACEHEMINLSVPVIPNASYSWYGPNGFISNGNSLVLMDVSTSQAGVYSVLVEVEGCLAVQTEETNVYINESPLTPVLADNAPACEGSELKLYIDGPVIVPPDSIPVFEWFYQSTNNLIGTTNVPELTIPNATSSSNGVYFVALASGECVSPFSNSVNIQIGTTPNEEAIAGEDQVACSETSISLNAETPVQSIGTWSSPTGATFTDAGNPDAEVANLEVGENIFIWSLSVNECDPFDSDTVIVYIDDTGGMLAFAGEDLSLCGEQNINLNAAPTANGSGMWTQPQGQSLSGIIISNPALATTEIEGVEIGETYTFYWTIYDSVCDAYSEDEVELTINEAPDNVALVPIDSLYSCGDNVIEILAIAPDIGSGNWTSNSGASISNPGTPVVIVGNLNSGASEFVWSISYEACEHYDSDTLVVIYEMDPIANSDNYFTESGESIIEQDLLLNDNLGNINSWQISILEEPNNGVLSENIMDGIFDYQPENGFYGQDKFIYELCNIHCPADCDTALVSINVDVSSDIEDCWVPDVITPNGDGANDVLEIPCLNNFPENNLTIYNRWGDKVFEKKSYRNDWDGTFRGSDLPPGTYYFFLQLSPDHQVIQGFLTLVR